MRSWFHHKIYVNWEAKGAAEEVLLTLDLIPTFFFQFEITMKTKIQFKMKI